jgi:hypothetical protein
MTEHGLSTLAYVPDPHDRTIMRNILQDYMRFESPAQVTTCMAWIKPRFDSYDLQGTTDMLHRLLNAMSAKMKTRFYSSHRQGTVMDLTFPEAFMHVVSLLDVDATSLKDSYTEMIMASTPDKVGTVTIARRDRKLAEEQYRPALEAIISAGGHFPFKVLTKIAQVAHASLPPDSENTAACAYKLQMVGLVTDLQELERKVAPMMDEVAKTDEYDNADLWGDSLLKRITSYYEMCKKQGGWSPGSGPTDSKTPEANKLDFDQSAGSKSSGGSGKGPGGRPRGPQPGDLCNKCGKRKGHWARECPYGNQGGGGGGNGGGNRSTSNSNSSTNSRNNNGGGRGRFNRNNGGNSGGRGGNTGGGSCNSSNGGTGLGKTTPPAQGAPWTKMINGEKHDWCPKCGRSGKWVTTHTGAEHQGRGNGSTATAPPSSSAGANMGLVDEPTLWFCPVIADIEEFHDCIQHEGEEPVGEPTLLSSKPIVLNNPVVQSAPAMIKDDWNQYYDCLQDQASEAVYANFGSVKSNVQAKAPSKKPAKKPKGPKPKSEPSPDIK